MSSKQQLFQHQQVMLKLIIKFNVINFKQYFLVLFNLFDLESNKLLNFKELVLMFTSIIRGLAVMTGQPLPEYSNLQKYAQTLFSRADLNNDQNLQLGEILGWFQSHTDSLNLFSRFEVKQLGKQSYHVFNGFTPYTQSQVDIMFQRLKRIYNNQSLFEEDFKILQPILRIPRNSHNVSNNKQNSQLNYSSFLKSKEPYILDDLGESQNFINLQVPSNRSKNKLQSSGLKNNNKYKMPSIYPNKSWLNKTLSHSSLFQKSLPEQSQKLPKKPYQPNKISNQIIIIKGRTITKKQIFDLRDYFDKISNRKSHILIEDFLESFNQQKYNHMKSVAASLFNFLDRRQDGMVDFKQLVLKLYPDLTRQHLKMIQQWSQQYSSNFNLDQKIKQNRKQQQHKKRVLPKSCMPRFRQIYLLFDRQNKEYVTIEDLKRVLGDVSTEKELQKTFDDCDKDKDGKLSFQEFSHILLPPDLEIEGLLV